MNNPLAQPATQGRRLTAVEYGFSALEIGDGYQTQAINVTESM